VARDSGRSILVRGLDPKTVQRLKAQASVNGRALEQEIQEILERAARMLTMREAGKPVGYSRVAAGEGHAGLPWGGRGNHEKVLRTAYRGLAAATKWGLAASRGGGVP
jgi:plasmid stability protein